MTGAAYETCTCGCGREPDAAYWHAWQAGRAYGWETAHALPVWWLRLRAWVAER